MPYEAHLRDIYDISKNKLDPTHTTANSIRHILETINKFKYPTKNFEDFFDEISELKEHEYLYSIIQDCSHGRIRTQIPFEKSMRLYKVVKKLLNMWGLNVQGKYQN